MGLDCVARDHAPQKTSRETAILACIKVMAGITISKSERH